MAVKRAISLGGLPEPEPPPTVKAKTKRAPKRKPFAHPYRNKLQPAENYHYPPSQVSIPPPASPPLDVSEFVEDPALPIRTAHVGRYGSGQQVTGRYTDEQFMAMWAKASR